MATGSHPVVVDWLSSQAAAAQGGKPVDNKPAGLMIRVSRVIDKASSE